MAAPSAKVDVCNYALSILKVSEIVSIEPPDDGSKPAEVMAKWYDQARRHTLQDHPWSFAKKKVLISAESDAPAFGFTKKYELPSDFIRIAYIGESPQCKLKPEEYEIANGYIECDETAPLKLCYIYNIEDISKFSPQSITSMAYKLAELGSYEITGDKALRKDMLAFYDDAIASAESINGQDNPPQRVQESRFRNARQRRSG